MCPLPWRRDYDPYSVWISEIMLQQTQMERGVKYFNAWLRTLPTIQSVAEASEETILSLWEGLGYYSRARNLQAAAKIIVDKYDSNFPAAYEAIRALPGIGEYTAGAIASIAFNQAVPAIDANVMRIFTRILDIDTPLAAKATKSRVKQRVGELLATTAPRLFNQALMELGALVCTKNPSCAQCPVNSSCLAFRRGIVAERPLPQQPKRYTYSELAAGIVFYNKRIYIQKRPPEGLWASLWEFPHISIASNMQPEQALARYLATIFNAKVKVREKIAVVKHGYTTNRVTLHGFMLDAAEKAQPAIPDNGVWIYPREAENYAFAAGYRKLLEKLGLKPSSTQSTMKT